MPRESGGKSSDEGAGGGELELAADGVVGGLGVGPLGVGGELEPHAAGGGLGDEGVAVHAGSGGAADGSGLLGLDAFVEIEGGLEFGAFGLGDFGEFVVGGFVVDGLGPAFEDGTAVIDLLADAVFGEGGGVFEEVFLAGAGLEEADDGDEGGFGFSFLGSALLFPDGGGNGGGAFSAGIIAEGHHGLDAGLGDVVFAGFLAIVEGDEGEEVVRPEGGAADFLGLGERGELACIQWRRGGAGNLDFRRGGCGGGVTHGGIGREKYGTIVKSAGCDDFRKRRRENRGCRKENLDRRGGIWDRRKGFRASLHGNRQRRDDFWESRKGSRLRREDKGDRREDLRGRRRETCNRLEGI
jgi:hypothetical protein